MVQPTKDKQKKGHEGDGGLTTLAKEAVQKLRPTSSKDQLHSIEESEEPLNEVNTEKTAGEEKNITLDWTSPQ
jgi:hypothetical protein